MKKRRLLYLLIAVLGTMFLFGCSKEEAKKEDSTKEEKSTIAELEDGELKIGLCPEYPPFESLTDSGDMEGFDISLAKAIGEELGVKVTFVNTPWEGLVPGLNNGDFDMIMSAMSPEEATSATDAVNLSDAYYELGDAIAIKKGDTSIKSQKDLADKIVGVQAACTAEEAAKGLDSKGIKVKELKSYNRNAEAFAELENGRIQAVVVSFPYAVTQSKEGGNFDVVNDPLQKADLVAVMKKGSDDFTAKFNDALKSVKDSGKYADIEKEWLSVK
ncbi:transporter substrate-binding domain-containing protein [Asaccharospora irregularis]|uniref:Amino acid ABC transporter substrate-binding protein, PAAT family n=1 Tax=Asaccharospora irregularis DSM 2635 TaxID=1121321 RepID=A0A1M5MA29_9FIRM|nr:transporter substrate-binding domain-containing protein [Asaccharospora irregularis]SHG74106.1 amino acid ABC transporter substrate-binding protein, PAAT family [Asaccharospora irregularis DSM 2635]